MTQLTPTLYAVEVQDNSYDFRIVKNTLEWFKTTGGSFCYRDLPDGNWELLGTVTPDAIDFDCEEYVQKGGMKDTKGMYQYFDDNGDLGGVTFFSTKEQCFRYIMQSKGLLVSNKYVVIKAKINGI